MGYNLSHDIEIHRVVSIKSVWNTKIAQRLGVLMMIEYI